MIFRSCDRRASRGVDSARGRIAMDFGGDACDGYTLKYRQVTVLNSNETGARTVDTQTATFEAGDGLSMRFKTTSSRAGVQADSGVDGDAQFAPGRIARCRPQAARRAPASRRPASRYSRPSISSASSRPRRQGQSTLSIKVYDGSDDGKKVYDTLGLIGRRIEPGAATTSMSRAGRRTSRRIARWPVTISYFADGAAIARRLYTISFELYENGVSRALKLDYGDFALQGDLQSLQIQPVTACQR